MKEKPAVMLPPLPSAPSK